MAVLHWKANENLADFLLFRHVREGNGERTALLYESSVLSYRHVAELAGRAAAVLNQIGVRRGDPVALLLPDVPCFVAAFFGTLAQRAVAVPVNPALNADDIALTVSHVGARVVIAHHRYEEKLLCLRSLLPSAAVILAGDAFKETCDFEERMAKIPDPIHRAEADAGEIAYCLLSSGTTGPPKAIAHRHTDILHCAESYAVHVLAMSSDDIVLSVPKLPFGYGLGGNLLFSFAFGGAAILIPEVSTAQAIIAAAERYRPTLFLSQPRLLSELLGSGLPLKPFSTVRICVSAGEVLASSLFDHWVRQTRIKVLDGFGSTEVGHIFISNRPGKIKSNSAGMVLPGYEVRIVDDCNCVLGNGETGVLIVRGASVMPFYWNDPELTERALRDGWYASQDLFRRDDEGFLYFCGRADDLIKAGCGEWVSPIEVEDVLMRSPAVLECAVVGFTDANGIVRPTAYVVLHPGVPPSVQLSRELEQLVICAWPELRHKHLGAIQFCSELPRSSSGKIQRFKLRPVTLTEFSYTC